MQFTHICCHGRRAPRDASTASSFFSFVAGAPPTAPGPAAAHIWRAAEPHTPCTQAMHPCFPPPPAHGSPALPPRPRARTSALLMARRNYTRRPPSATAQRFAPPWPQIMILDFLGIYISRIIPCEAVFWGGFSFSLPILGQWTCRVSGVVRGAGRAAPPAERRVSHYFTAKIAF